MTAENWADPNARALAIYLDGDDIRLGPQSIVVLRSQVRPATKDGSAT